MDSAGIIHPVLENKESLLDLHSVDGSSFYFTYIKYIFKTIQLARRICLQKDEGINHRFTDLVPRFGTIFLRYGIDRDSTFTWLEMLPQKNDLKIPISEGRVVLKVDILQYCVCTVPICGSRENPTSGKKKKIRCTSARISRTLKTISRSIFNIFE